MLIVIALGGNALLQRGEPLESELQRKNVKETARAIARLAKEHQVVICHGNGPQVGLLALQNCAYTQVKPYPLDVLDAESQGMIGYLIQQEVGNLLPDRSVVTLLTQIVVDVHDKAFQHPTKPIGPVYHTEEEAKQAAQKEGWKIAPDGKYFRRVVPSPEPKEVVELETIQLLLNHRSIVICGGGGGIPVVRNPRGLLEGSEAVIDKDNTASLIAEKLQADALLILTDVPAVCVDWGTPNQKAIKQVSAEKLAQLDFAKGSMGPKVYASCRFVSHSRKMASIGRLFDIEKILKGEAGTRVSGDGEELVYY